MLLPQRLKGFGFKQEYCFFDVCLKGRVSSNSLLNFPAATLLTPTHAIKPAFLILQEPQRPLTSPSLTLVLLASQNPVPTRQPTCGIPIEVIFQLGFYLLTHSQTSLPEKNLWASGQFGCYGGRRGGHGISQITPSHQRFATSLLRCCHSTRR